MLQSRQGRWFASRSEAARQVIVRHPDGVLTMSVQEAHDLRDALSEVLGQAPVSVTQVATEVHGTMIGYSGGTI